MIYVYIYVYIYIYVNVCVLYVCVYIYILCIPEVLLSPSLFQELSSSDLSTEVPWEKPAFLGRGRWSVSIKPAGGGLGKFVWIK